MSGSVESAVSASLAMQNYNLMQQKNALVLRKVLDTQANSVAQLVNSLSATPQLATSGSVGTQLHTTA